MRKYNNYYSTNYNTYVTNVTNITNVSVHHSGHSGYSSHSGHNGCGHHHGGQGQGRKTWLPKYFAAGALNPSSVSHISGGKVVNEAMYAGKYAVRGLAEDARGICHNVAGIGKSAVGFCGGIVQIVKGIFS